MSTFVKSALQHVRSKLLDLTRRNRLLNYKESVRSIRVVDELPDEVFRILAIDGKEMEFLPLSEEEVAEQQELIAEPREKSSNNLELPLPTPQVAKKHKDSRLQTPFSDRVLERRCKKLLQESKTAIEETGSNLLYLAMGFLEWYEDDNSSEINRAPLFLVPVMIEKTRVNRETNCYSYVISYTGEDIETNLSLAEKLNRDYGLILPSLEDEILPEQYLEEVSRTVSKMKRWRVAREMVLGLFSFAKLLMYKDLDNDKWPDNAKLIENIHIGRIIGGRQEGDVDEDRIYGEEYDIDHDPRVTQIPLILDADSSQTSVIIDAIINKESLVVEGPPGTGKSQTIANLIAAALSSGLSVLFVAEKKAALDVVRSRLDHSGLGDFCLELHSHKTQKGQLHADINKRFNKTYRDSRDLDQEIGDMVIERDRLLEYSNLVNSVVGPNGETIYDIFWIVEKSLHDIAGHKLQLRVSNALQLNRQQINDRIHVLQDVARLLSELPEEAVSAWQGFRPKSFIPGDEINISHVISTFLQQVDAYNGFLTRNNVADIVPLKLNMADLQRLSKSKKEILLQKPSEYIESLAPKFTIKKNVEIINGLHSKILEFKQLRHVSEAIESCLDGDLTNDKVVPIAEAASRLESLGHGDSTPKQLQELENHLGRSIIVLQSLEVAANSVRELFNQPPEKPNECERIVKLCQVLEAAPSDFFAHQHPEYVLESTSQANAEVLSRCNVLSEQMKEHAEIFLLRYLPDHNQIIDAARNLRKFRGSFFSVFSSEYWKLRRTIKGFLVNVDTIKAHNLVECLENLADTIKAIEEIKINEQNRRTLGPLYEGIETNWQKLGECIRWGQEFRYAVGTESHAYSTVMQTPEMKPAIVRAKNTVEEDLSALNLACEVLKIDKDRHISSLMKDLSEVKCQIERPLNQLLMKGLSLIDISSISSAAQSFLSASKLQKSLGYSGYPELLGDYYQKMDTDTNSILKTVQWISDLSETGNIPKGIVEWIVATDTDTRGSLLFELIKENTLFINHCDCFQSEMGKYGEFLSEHYFSTDVSGFTLTEVRSAVAACLDNTQYLVTWNDYQNTIEESISLGLQDITESIALDRISPEESGAIYHHAVYESMAREIISRNSGLKSFTRTSFEGVRKRFATLDRQIMKSFRERIAHKTSARPIPAGVGYGPVKEHTDRHLLERELLKKKRHIPIRQLVRRAGRALQAIKPCFMMSPMSVAQYLEPGNISFDLVVMDEASQLRPEDALGAIARARQLVVVGDPNQLPPTNFFDKVDEIPEDDDEIAAIQDTESILDICMITYQKRRLRWHYRSEHESLIAFSNHQFYDDNLIIFPSPKGKNRNYGLHRHYIEGATYVKGLNRVEAEATAIAVLEHFRSHSSLSLGVATFNREQADLIQDVLERMQKENPWLERKIRETDSTKEPFFVKNLENVQGDERDVIFVSTTYGPDLTTGKVFQRFGPIAGDTGWRRLNVIFTRAKKRLELFTSLRSSDIRLNDKPTKGTQSLKAYLEYAETGLLPDYGSIGSSEPDSDFEVSVSKHLGLHGFKTVAQVGVAGFFIDIGVLHPERDGEFILGIECDGAAYHSSKSARDRDRLRQEILEHKGWKIHRIWSTDWFKNRDNEIARMLNVVRSAVKVEESEVSSQTDEHIEIDVQLAEFINKMKSETQDKEPTKAQQAQQTERKVSGLREELLEYRKTNILANFPDMDKCILRDDMLNFLIRFKPTSLNEFHQSIPANIRQKTDAKQMQFINDVFEIIEGYV